MSKQKVGVRFLKGSTDILIIAPHAAVITNKDGNKKYRNDRRTGIIAEELRKKLRCYAIINDSFLKPTNKYPQNLINHRLDLYKLAQAKKYPDFLDHIKKVVDSDGHTLVLWIHGMEDSSALSEGQVHIQRKLFNGGPSDLQALIGYGQGMHPRIASMPEPTAKDKSDRFTAKTETAENLKKLLNKLGLTTLIARSDASNFRGRDPKRLNQWFVKQNYNFEQVESIQIEIREQDCRDNSKNCRKTAKIIYQVMSALVRSQEQDTKPPNENVAQRAEPKASIAAEKVRSNVDESSKEQSRNTAGPEADTPEMDKIYAKIMKYFHDYSEPAMLKAGRYLFKTFYKNKIDSAKEDKEKKPLYSLHKYINDLHGKDPGAPGKSWIYNSVKLAVDDKELKAYLKDDFHMYGKDLNLSQKVLLLTEGDIEKKVQFIREIAVSIKKSKKPLTFMEFKKRFIASGLGKKGNGTNNPSLLRVIDKPEKLFSDGMSKFLTPEALKQLPSSKFEKLLSKAKNSVVKIETNIKQETDYLQRYKELIETIKNTSKPESEEHSPVPQAPKKKVIIHDDEGIALRPQNKIDSHNFPFTLNTTIGCHFGCSYCYLQGFPFNRYTIFGQEVKVKTWIPEKLDQELNKYRNLPQHLKRVQVNPATEGYLPYVMTKLKKDLNRDIMLEVLKVFRKHWEQGNCWMVHLLTKSHMVRKHLDVIADMKDQVQLELTITTLDENRKKLLEGLAPSVKKRLDLIKEFSEAGVFVRVMAMPCIGNRNDAEKIKRKTFDHGARGFKHKSLNYFDEEKLLKGELVRTHGRKDEVFEDLLEKSSEPIQEKSDDKKMIVKMPVIIKPEKTKKWRGYKDEDLQDKEMIMENSGYSSINKIDWGYVV